MYFSLHFLSHGSHVHRLKADRMLTYPAAPPMTWLVVLRTVLLDLRTKYVCDFENR